MHHSLHEQLAGLLVANRRNLIDGVDDEIGLAASVPNTSSQISFFGRGLETAWFVGTYVAITTEFWIGNIAYLSTKDGLLVEMVVIKEPHGAFPVGHRHHAQFQIGILSPAPVLQAIDAHSVDIARLAIVGRVEGHAIHLKADMAMVVFLDHSKHWAVAGLQAPVGITAIEGTRKTVVSVLADHSIALREILLLAHLILLAIVIRG